MRPYIDVIVNLVICQHDRKPDCWRKVSSLPVLEKSGVAFFAPDVGVVVIPGLLPESRVILAGEFQPAQPFSAFPEIRGLQLWLTRNGADDPAQREAVLGAERLPVVVRGKQEVFRSDNGNRQVGGKPIFCVLNDVCAVGQDIEDAFIDFPSSRLPDEWDTVVELELL